MNHGNRAIHVAAAAAAASHSAVDTTANGRSSPRPQRTRLGGTPSHSSDNQGYRRTVPVAPSECTAVILTMVARGARLSRLSRGAPNQDHWSGEAALAIDTAATPRGEWT